jgi:putative ABC transport system permease protein
MRAYELIALRLRSLFRRNRMEGELGDEMRFHLDQLIEENVASGMSPKDARHAAMRTIGGVTQIEEECRDMRRTAWFENSVQDLKYAMRALRKTPGFTFVAVLSLALGIGANTAVFSVVHAVLVRSLPYAEPGRIVRLIHRDGGNDYANMPEFHSVSEHSTSFTSVAANHGDSDAKLEFGGNIEWLSTGDTTPGYFQTLGVPMAVGRDFTSDEARQGGPHAVILTWVVWQRAFRGDPSFVGRSVKLANVATVVAGVLPQDFWTPNPVDAYVPIRSNNEGYNTSVLARLKPGVSIDQANAELLSITETFKRERPDLVGSYFTPFSVTSYQRWLTGDVRTNLLLLFSAVVFLLVIACSNLASLLFARLAARQREIAVRLALGSSSGRLLRLFVLENAILVAAGATAGLIAASWSLDGLLHLLPYTLPAAAPIALDRPVLLFTIGISLATALAFSLVPVLISSRVKVDQALKAGRSQSTGIRQRIRSVLVVSEVALATAMLVAAALLIVSLFRQRQEKLGFDPKDVITFRTPATDARQGKAIALRQFEADLSDRIRTIPGVRGIALANVLPLTSKNNFPTQRQGHPENGIGGMEIRIVTPEYFETMRIRMLRGRGFSASDTRNTLPVAIVNETVAAAWWKDENPLGDHVEIGRMGGKIFGDGEPPREVIGVAGDTKGMTVVTAAKPTVYIPMAQGIYEYAMPWVVRADLPAAAMPQIMAIVNNLDPQQRVLRMRTMDEVVAATMADSRFDAYLFGIFAGIALLLTAVGVYGLLAFFVAQRTGEIGIRLALGATQRSVLAMVMKQSVALITIGLMIGLGGAMALTRLFAKLLFGVKATDPWTFAAVALLLMAVGIAASLLPARRAVRIDPMVALRYE